MADKYEIAAWRFEQIAPFLDASMDASTRREAMRERCRIPVLWPLSQAKERRGEAPKNKPVPRSTRRRWLKAYKKDGFAGLFPKRRQDRERPRRKGLEIWIPYALGLLYEQPDRSLTQLDLYLRVEFEGYDIGRSTLNRHLVAHPAYSGIEELRSGKPTRLRDLYEASRPHECWQLDGRGPFRVHLKKGGVVVSVHVLSVIDDFSRYLLASVVAYEENTEATVRVFQKAVLRWGLADRFQFDRGSAFDSKLFRGGIAQLGVHRNFIKAKSPEWDGKIEAYHRCLNRWFVKELKAQEVVDLEHLQQLLDAEVALLYNPHHHRSIGQAPEKRLGGALSSRRVSPEELSQAFLISFQAKSHPKTGQVDLPSGSFRVPLPYAGRRGAFRYDPISPLRAVLLTPGGKEIDLEPFRIRPLPSPTRTDEERRGTGQLQKLLDLWQGKERPNAQPGFGLPEVFTHLGGLLDRMVPKHQQEAREILAFYRTHGPLPREPFERACRRTKAALGEGRPLKAYLEDLTRQIEAQAKDTENDPGNVTENPS